LPNVGPYIYDVSIYGFTRSSIYIYIYDISSLRVNKYINNININRVVFDCILLMFHDASTTTENKMKLRRAYFQTSYVISFHFCVCR